jgi:hypothetical protein
MKRVMLVCCFLMAALMMSSFAMAAENSANVFSVEAPATAAEHAVGLSVGPTKGNGLTYRTIDHSTGIGYQLTALPLVGRDEGVVFGGVSALYVLHHGNSGIAYVSIGAAGAYGWDNCGDDDDTDCKDDSVHAYSFGPGVGAEFRFWDNFGLSLEIPIAVMVEDNKFAGVFPIPNSSLVYFW